MDITRLVLAADSTQIRQAKGQVDQLQRSGVQANRGMQAMTKTVAKLGAVLATAFSVQQIQRFVRTSVKEFADLERSQMRLTKQIELMGAQSWITADEIEGMANRIDRATLESAANVRQAASVLMTAQGMTRESFERTMAVAVDMGEVLGLALPTSARYLVRAMGDTSGAMSMFRRYGIELEQSVQDQIAALQEAGQEAEAYGLLLSNLESRFEGAAKAAGKGLAGSLDDLSRAGRNLREALGQELSPAVKTMADDMTAWVDANRDFLAQDVGGHILSIGKAASWTAGMLAHTLKRTADMAQLAGVIAGSAVYGFDPKAIPENMARVGFTDQQKSDFGILPRHRIDYNDMKERTGTMPSAPTPTAMHPEFYAADMPPMIEPLEELPEDYINVVRELGNVGKSWQDQEIERIEEQAHRWELMYGDRVDTSEWSASKINEIEQQLNDQRVAMYASAAGQIAATFMQIAQAGGKQSEAAFRAYQAFAMTQAAISGFVAYNKALADPSLITVGQSQVMANVMAGLAAVQVGMIAAAQPPSFDSGGISRARGIYRTGDIDEAHVPVPSGKIPVELSGAGRQVTNHFNIRVDAPEGTLDRQSLRQLQATLGRSINRAMEN